MPLGGFPTNQIDVLNAIKERIKSQVSQLAGANLVWLSLADPIPEERQNIFATITPLGGTFDEGFFVGTGSALELAGVQITVYSANRLDRPDADESMLTDPTRGLLALKHALLVALTNWMPTDADSGIGLLERPMRPTTSGHPGRASEDAGMFSLNFATDFLWSSSL